MSSAAEIYQNEPLLRQLEIYEVGGIDDQQRMNAAEFAVGQYGAGYSYGGLLIGNREASIDRKWYCTELVVAALEQSDVKFYAGTSVVYQQLYSPVLPYQMKGYRTMTGSGAPLITTLWGNSQYLKKTYP